jgi:ATP-dependent helicase/DNAse subunit B
VNKTFIYCGTQRSSRKEGILQIIKENYPHVFLIVPTRQYAQKRSIELLNYIDTAGIYGDIVSDFSLFAYNLLQRQDLPVRKLEEWEQNVLMKSIILSEEGKQRFKGYKGLLAPENLANAFCRVIRNLKQAGITPEEFESKLKLQRSNRGMKFVMGIFCLSAVDRKHWYDIRVCLASRD